MKKLFILLPLLAIGVSIFFSCRHELSYPASASTGGNGPGSSGGGTTTADSGSCSADTVYFIQSILPLISSNCAQSGCHSGTLDNYNGIRSQVRPGNASSGDFMEAITSGQMPPAGHTPLSSTQINELKTWINQGALNNSCTPGTCDTTAVTYSATIAPILQTYCTGCHSGSAPSGAGIDLSAYAGVVTQAKSGKLWGDINHLSGYNAMPLGGAMLSTCELSKIHVWINAGTPNN